MIARVLHWASLAATAILLASFVLFATDETAKGSEHQVARIAAAGDAPPPVVATTTDLNRPNPSPALRQERARRHGSLRELVDRGNDVLTRPFVGIVNSRDIWVERGVPTLLGLLLFGFGLQLVANYAGRSA